jgi:hypothetical protein
MFDTIIRLGLVVIPFISIPGQDIRELKLSLVLFTSLILAVLALREGLKVTNKYALFLIPYLWLSTMLAPSSGIKLDGAPLGIFWAWKPYIYIVMVILAISAIGEAKLNVRKILTTMFWCGFAMAAYVWLQFLNLDQFFKQIGPDRHLWYIAGTLGHLDFVGAFMAMIVPVGVYLKKHHWNFVIISAVILTQGLMAIGSMIMALLFLLACRSKKGLVGAVSIFILLGALCGIANKIKPESITSSGRVDRWVEIVKDVNKPISHEFDAKFPLTGRGLGSFYYTFHSIHKNGFYQAHNEYLEFLYNCGIVGLGVMLLAMWEVVRNNWRKNWYRNCLLASFFCVALNAGGMFVWQLGATAFYTIVIVGLLCNNQEGEKCHRLHLSS